MADTLGLRFILFIRPPASTFYSNSHMFDSAPFAVHIRLYTLLKPDNSICFVALFSHKCVILKLIELSSINKVSSVHLQNKQHNFLFWLVMLL